MMLRLSVPEEKFEYCKCKSNSCGEDHGGGSNVRQDIVEWSCGDHGYPV